MVDLFGVSTNFQSLKAPPLQIYVGTTWVKFRANRNGTIGAGLDLSKFMRQNLQEYEWVPQYRSYITTHRYSFFDEKTQMAVLPRYILPRLISFLGATNYELIDVPAAAPSPIKIKPRRGIVPRDDQRELLTFMTSDIPYKPVNFRTGGGKELENDAPIKIPGGWTTHGEVKVGDIITAWDGTPSKVTGVFPQGLKTVFRVTFKDGRFVDAGRDHLWTIITRDNCSQTVTTLELIQLLQKPEIGKRIYVPVCGSEIIDDVSLPIDPYTLGILLGDGSLSQKRISLDTDRFCVEEIQKTLPDSICINDLGNARQHCEAFSFVRNNTQTNEYIQHLKDLKLYGTHSWDKFIPTCYLNSSHSQRLSLLQGLLDSDGHATIPGICRNGIDRARSGKIEYSTTSKQLALDVQYLIRSIGGICTIKEKIPFFTYKGEYKQGRTAYILRIRYAHPANLFRLPRKKERLSVETQYTKYFKLRVVSVEPLLTKKECTCISIDHPSQLYVTKDFIVTHNTVTAELAICEIGLTTMIVLGNLISQWYKSIKQHLNIASHEIYVVQGFTTLKNLWEMGKNGYHPKIIIFSTRTLHLYAVNPKGAYEELPSYEEFQQFFGIGVKIMDEVHLNFNANTMIDLRSNIQHNIYLSATYQRSHYLGKRIFDIVFPAELRFGEQFTKKYTTVNVVSYQLGIDQQDTSKFVKKKGYNHALYENYLRKRPKLFAYFVDKVLVPLINMYYVLTRSPGQRLLVLCATKVYARMLEKVIQKHFGGMSSSVYFSGEKGREGKDENLLMDIIISTPQSCGVGRDIPQLKTCINTLSFSSEPLANQILGRLREIPDEETIYIDIWNREVNTHHRHMYDRSEVYKQKALKYFESQIC